MIEWKKTEAVRKEFCEINKNRHVTTIDSVIQSINPQDIIAINETYDYPDILNDYKMEKLKNSVKSEGWKDKQPRDFCLLMLPDGKMLVNGGGNHRAVLAKELSIESVKANVAKVIYLD
ncbi:hypothetical protein CQZ91_13415 [Bacillus cereus]|uniref:hypothetical protein n=1 Tax=Bacillus cereus TaxID=1396 RepID=UPI000994D008|nr:hypothetical protein [Bacillus cereus]OOZ97605.1 hypothetical protein BHL51_18675 [Bacillus cereus]PRC98127.1 hypothetical protein CQZ92_17080 [Bacillus cereus]PRD03365.1 hypothetical protein CQZ91_13415 [Bacillus cereus]